MGQRSLGEPCHNPNCYNFECEVSRALTWRLKADFVKLFQLFVFDPLTQCGHGELAGKIAENWANWALTVVELSYEAID